MADDESSGSDLDEEEHPMTFNRREIETLENLLQSAEKYVGREDSIHSDSDSSIQADNINISQNIEELSPFIINRDDHPPTEANNQAETQSQVRMSNYTFASLERDMRSADTTSISLSILMEILLNGAPILTFFTKTQIDGECGIPIKFWITVLICLISANITQKLILLTIVRFCRRSRFVYSIISTGVVYFCLCTWLFYGNALFYSKMNNCVTNPETSRMAHLMIFFLGIGYVHMAYGIAYAILLPQAVMKYFFLQKLERKANQEIIQISESLNRVGFDPTIHKYETTCAICMNDF